MELIRRLEGDIARLETFMKFQETQNSERWDRVISATQKLIAHWEYVVGDFRPLSGTSKLMGELKDVVMQSKNESKKQ